MKDRWLIHTLFIAAEIQTAKFHTCSFEHVLWDNSKHNVLFSFFTAEEQKNLPSTFTYGGEKKFDFFEGGGN